jgi:phospholipase/carboxylesterase
MRKIATLLLIAACLALRAQDMKPVEGLALKYLVQLPQDKSAHPPVFILLHGYGSNEADLFDLRTVFPKNYLVISARAPYALPGGGYQWYQFIGGLDRLVPDTAQLSLSRATIKTFVSQIVAKYKADAGNVYIGGFSQGAIMSYEVGLTSPELVKGIAILSGKMNASPARHIARGEELKRLRIFISHGTADNRIRFEDGKAAVAMLQKWGAKPQFHSYAGMGHTISNDVMKDLLKWLTE